MRPPPRVLRLGAVGQDDAADGGGLDLGVHRHGVPVEDHVGDVLGVAAEAVLVPQGDGRQVLEQDGLGLGVEAQRRGLVARRGRLGQKAVELLRGVVRVVGAGAGLVDGAEEIVHRGVVRLPAGAEGADEGAVGDLLAQLGELGDGQGLHGDAQGVGHRVADGLDPCLVGAVGVVGEGELAAGGLPGTGAGRGAARAGAGAAAGEEDGGDAGGAETEGSARDQRIVHLGVSVWVEMAVLRAPWPSGRALNWTVYTRPSGLFRTRSVPCLRDGGDVINQ